MLSYLCSGFSDSEAFTFSFFFLVKPKPVSQPWNEAGEIQLYLYSCKSNVSSNAYHSVIMDFKKNICSSHLWAAPTFPQHRSLHTETPQQKEMKGAGAIPAGELLPCLIPNTHIRWEIWLWSSHLWETKLWQGSNMREWAAASAASHGSFVTWCKSLFIICFWSWKHSYSKVHSRLQGGLFPTTILSAGAHFKQKHRGHRVNGSTCYKAQETNVVPYEGKTNSPLKNSSQCIYPNLSPHNCFQWLEADW